MIQAMMAPDVTNEPPPDAAPLEASLYRYDGLTKLGVQWESGDPDASTEIGFREDENGILEPLGQEHFVGPGVTQWETGLIAEETSRCYYWVRHVRGGESTAWVRALHGMGCSGEVTE